MSSNNPHRNPENVDTELLPADYDRLIPIEKLTLGEHNPRQVKPTSSLRRSINKHGINLPLIVRPDSDPEHDVYHITDGWQRYQAATDCGWEALPVKIYETPLDALEATETASIVREWSTYDWARYCQSLATELDENTCSTQELLEEIADRTVKSVQTVRRYLDVLSLPEVVHPLLTHGPQGTQQQWAALRNHNKNIRYYGDLWWPVAARLGRNQSEISEQRVIGIAAKAVEFDNRDDATTFVERAISEPERSIKDVQKRVLFGKPYERYLEVPRVAVQLSELEKQAIMDHCYETNQSLSDIVEREIRSLVEETM